MQTPRERAKTHAQSTHTLTAISRHTKCSPTVTFIQIHASRGSRCSAQQMQR